MIERKFVEEAVKRLKTREFIKKELERAGIVDVEIQRTPISTRIGIIAERIALVIGRKGSNIKELNERLEKELGIENPQLEVIEVQNPDLEPTVIARWVKRMIERGTKPRIAIKKAAKRVMDAGAIGVEIIADGTQSKGARSRKERVARGYLKKAGDPVNQIKETKMQAFLKQGVIGITVRIVPRELKFPDKIEIQKPGIEEIAEETTVLPEEKKAAEEIKETGIKELSEEVIPEKPEKETAKEVIKEIAEETEKKQVFKCEICGKEFNSKRGLSAHKRVHK